MALLLPAASGRETSCSPCVGAPCLCVFSSIMSGSILERKRHAGEERVVATINQCGNCFLDSDRVSVVPPGRCCTRKAQPAVVQLGPEGHLV